MKCEIKDGMLYVGDRIIHLTDSQKNMLEPGLFEAKLDEGNTFYVTDVDMNVIKCSTGCSLDPKHQVAVGNYCNEKEILQKRVLHVILQNKIWMYAVSHNRSYFPNRGHFSINWVKGSGPKVCVLRNYWYGQPAFTSSVIAQRCIDEVVIPFITEHPEMVFDESLFIRTE